MTYNNNIPQPTDRPSDSQSDLLNNFSALKTYLDRNHVAIVSPGGDVDEGKHTFCQFPEQGAGPATLANEGAVYTKVGASPAETNLFYRAESSGFEYQITKSIAAQTGTLGQNPGWSFLPGGLILQYAKIAGASNTDVITFPFAFPTACFGVVVNPIHVARNFAYPTAQPGTADFTLTLVNSANTGVTRDIFYYAIGN